MATIISHGLHDCTHIKIVSIISSFDCNGNIKPLYVRIDGESLKIYNAYLASSTFKILSFNCEVMDHSKLKPIKLFYHVNDHIWSMSIK